MDSELYKFFYESLHSHEDVEELSQKYGVFRGILSSILDQKVVEEVKKSHYRLKRKESKLVSEWNEGGSFLEMAKKYNYPATLISSLILQNNGYSKREIRNFYKNPNLIQDRRIRQELGESLNADYYFSPKAHRLQEEKGKTGEKLISFWLQKKKCEFKCEDEMRAKGLAGKTPDFLLKTAIKVYDRDVCWIESKALFGELKEHRNYAKKQFSEYAKCYGDGLVVYWFGFETDILNEKEDGYQVTDFELLINDFPGRVNRFLTSVTRW
ncbi:MAG: C15orf41 family protein [Methanimicrococcus sp.]|nr:C15orf41 family protein [Methanimicrococcus sp.]